jgi:hypothetical protein
MTTSQEPTPGTPSGAAYALAEKQAAAQRAASRHTAPARKRTCYYIPPDQRDDQGFIPSLVTEDEPGHQPFMGNGPCAQPWHWGRTYEQARDEAAKNNRIDFGLDEEQVASIILSSVRASRRAGRAFSS